MNKKIKVLLSLVLVLSFVLPLLIIVPNPVLAKYVNGYYRKDGTYVRGYYRSDHNSNYTYTPSYDTSSRRSNTDYTIYLYKGNSYYKTVPKSNLIFVQGYYRADGTYVRPHFRTHPNDFLTDNFSYLGISSLKPLQRYTNFKYSDNLSIAEIENYLAYEVSDISLNVDQLNSLKNYASIIHASTSDSSKTLSAVTNGIEFYTKLGVSKELALELVAFDISGKLTPSSYLSQILYQNNIYSLTEENYYLFQAYAFALAGSKDSQYGEFYATQTKKIGEFLYTKIGLSNPTIQVDMDIMQNFLYSDEHFRNISMDVDDMFLSNKSVYSTDEVNYYLNTIIKSYSGTGVDFSRYEASLWMLSNDKSMPRYLVKNGFDLYSKIGLSTEQTICQFSKDIVMFF